MIDNQDTIGDSGDFMADVRRANAERRMGMETAIEETAATGFVPGRVMPEPAMPAAPKFAGFTDEDAQLARRMAEDKKLAFMSTMMGAVDVNPDRAAEAIRFGNEVGVGPDIALNDFDGVQHAAKMKRIEQMNLMRRFPILARQLQDQAFANIAHDDLDNLAATEDVFSVIRGIPERIKGIPQGIAEGFKRGVATYELADLYERQRQSGGNLEVYQRAAIQSINDEMAQLGKESGFWESASNVVTLNLAQAPEVLETALATIAAGGLAGGAIGAAGGTMTTGGILAPVTAAGGAAAGMAIGMPAGLAAGAYESSRRLETALLYGEARRPTEEGGAGLDHEAANAAALAGGAISGLLEVAGVAVAGKAYSLALKNVIREGVKDAIKDRTRAQVFRTVGKTYLIGGAGEVSTEITQDIVNRASLEIAKAVRDQPTMFDNPGELRKFGGQLVDTALETAMAMTLLGIPGAAVQFHTGSRRAAEAERNAKFFDALAKNAAETKVAPRDGDKYRAYIGNIVNGTKFETMYVDAGEMRTVLQQQGLTLDDADSVFPGIKAQLEEIVGRTGDVTIPTAVYAERGARTDLGQAILPHVRPAPNAMSPLEAQQFAAERETLVREARSVLQEKERIDTVFVQEAQELEDVIRSEIRAARPDFDPAVARGWAKMSRDFYVVLAADLNTTPKALFEQRKLQRMQVRGVEGALPTPAAVAPSVPEFVAPPKPEGMDQKFYDDLIQRAIREVGGSPTVEVTRGVQPEGATTGIPLQTEANLRAAGNDAAADVYIAAAQQAADRNVAAFQARRAAAAAPSIMEQAATMDAEYMAAVERGDMATAQRMVDEAAKAAGYTIPVYHFTDETFTAFDVQRGEAGPGIWLTSSPEGWFGENRLNLYLNPGKIENVKSQWDKTWREGELSIEGILEGDLETMSSRNIETLRNTGDYNSTFYVATRPEQVKSADPVTYDEDGNVIPLSRRFNITSPRIFEQAAMSTRVPTAVKPIEDALNDVLLADFPSFLRDEKFVSKNLAKFKELNAPIRIDPNATEQQQLEQIISHMTSNLLWLHDAMEPAIRERARMWYVGGRRLVDWLAERHGMSPMGAATVFAVLSPQKNWYENVGLGIRIIDIVATQGSATMDAEMQDAYLNSLRKEQTKSEGKLSKHDAARPERGKKEIEAWETKRAELSKEAKAASDKVAEAQGNIDAIGKRTLADLLRDREFFLAAIMVRWFDQTKNNRTYPVISPEGGVGSPMLTEAGTPASIRYGSYNEVSKAIAAYVDGRAENVHYLIGGEHKVRNFYNNLFNPEDPRFATIDTHAIAAAYLMPLAGTDKLVQHGLGGGVGNAMFGMGGGYAVFYEAYRRAAEARGIQPREMQSITWEAIRGMFEAAMKGGLKAPVAATWKRYVDGEIDIDAARADVMQRAGGITTPTWVSLPMDMKPAAGYEGVSRTAADAQAGRIAAKPTAASVMFEVAPDPADAALVQRWEALSPQQRQAISVRVAEDIIPRILREYGVAADMVMQVGGWEGATNVGFALRMPPGPLVRQIAQAVGYALSQQAVFTLSATQFQGSTKSDIIVLQLQPGTTVEQIGDLYEKKLFPLGIQGHATVQDSMIISLDPGVDGAILADTIAQAVAGDGRIVEITHATGWRSLDETRPTDEAARAADEGRRTEGAAGRRRVDAYRSEATRLVAEYLEQPGILEQAARGEARGGFDPVTFILTLGKNADLTTFGHEAAHAFFEMYGQIAVQPNAPQRIRDSFDVLLRWGSIAGETPEERIATWNALPFEGRRKLHESFAYNWEIYLFEGKAPSVEMRDLFRKFSAWIRRVYKTIREELTVPQTISAIYRERYGEELLVLTPEVRQVMDRMLASEEQIAYREAVDDMKPMLTGRPEGMSDEAWAEYESNAAAARQDAVDELTRQSMKDMQWLSRAKAPILKKIQAKNEAARSAIRDEVTEQVKAMPVYRAMSYLRRGKLVDADGTETETSGTHRLDIDLVRNMYELRERVERLAEPSPEEADIPTMESVEDAMRPNWRKLGTGKYGMLGSDGLAPDMVAEMFGYANGDIMVRELIAAKPMAEMIADETDRVMTERYGIMTSPEAIEIQVQEALHNEARARMVATELKFLRKAVQPIRVLTEAARQAAQDIVDKKVIRELRPAEYTASEARAARQASTAAGRPQDPQTAGKAAYTRTYNEQVAAGVSEEEAVLAASTALGEATARAERALAQWQDKYGGRDPAEIAIRAKQQQLLQNQLAAEALKARDAIDKALAGFRKFFKADAKIAETREMPLVMAARAILAQRGIGRSDKPAAAYLEQLKEYNPSIHESVSEIVIAAGVGDYRDMTVEDFRTMAEAVEALWVKAKRDRLIQVGDEKVELDAAVDSLVGRLEEIGIPKELPGERQAIQFKDKSSRFAMGVRAMARRIESWSDAMDGKGDDRSFTKLLYRIVKDASTAFKVRRNEQIKKMYELVAKLEMPEGKIAAEEINYTFGAGNAGIGKAELLGAMLHIGNQSNYRKLLVGRGWGQIDENGNLDDSRWRAFVSRMIQQNMLTKKDFDFLQAVWDLNEEIKPLLQKAHYDLEGYYFKEIEADQVVTPFGTYRGGYVPAATDKFMVADAAQRAGMEELQADWRYSLPSTGMGMTKARVKGYNRPLALDLRLIVSHTDAALRFAMIQPAIADVLKIVKNRRFSDAMNRVDPEVIQRLILPWLNRAAKQSVSEAGLFRPVDQFWTAARSRTGMSIMFASVRNAAQQVVGLFPAALKVKPTYLRNALVRYMASPLKTADMVAALSPFMQERLRNQAFDMQDRMNEILLNPSKYQKAQEWSRQHAYFLQTAFQNPVDVITWLGAYNQFLAEQSAGMKPEKAEREAIAAGDSAVRLTQGSMQPEDIATIEAGTPFFRTFTQFSGYFNAMGNLNATEFVKTMRDMGWRGNKGKLLYIYMLGIMAPAIVSDAIVRSLGGGWDDDDEDGYLDIAMDWFFGSQVRYVTAFVPFGTTGYTLVTTAFDNKPYNDRMTTSPAVTAIEASTVGVGKAIVNAVDPDKEITGKNVRDVLTLVSLATGLPVSAAGRPIGYLVDVERGKIEPEGPVDLVRGLLTGTVTPESKR